MENHPIGRRWRERSLAMRKEGKNGKRNLGHVLGSLRPLFPGISFLLQRGNKVAATAESLSSHVRRENLLSLVFQGSPFPPDKEGRKKNPVVSKIKAFLPPSSFRSPQFVSSSASGLLLSPLASSGVYQQHPDTYCRL